METIEKLKNLKPFQKTKNGTILFGDVQSLYVIEKQKFKVIGSYVHAIYSPLADKDAIKLLLQEIPLLPKNYMDFLKNYNGLNAFSDSLCLYGFGRILIEKQYVVSRNPDIVLPYHLGDYNKQSKDLITIGSFCEGKLVYIVTQQKYALVSKTNSVITTWDDITTLISQCLEELSLNYDTNGKLLYPTKVANIIFNKIIK